MSTKTILVTQSATHEELLETSSPTYAIIACKGSILKLQQTVSLAGVETIYQIPPAMQRSNSLDVHECVSNVIEGVMLTKRHKLILGVARVSNGVVDRVIEMRELRMFAVAKGINAPFGVLCKVFDLYDLYVTA